MGAIHLPVGRVRGQTSERSALRQGLAVTSTHGRRLRLTPKQDVNAIAFCDTCAGPIEFGAVLRGTQTFCSVECSLGGRPA